MMERKYRWWVVGGAVALVVAGGVLFSRFSVLAAPQPPTPAWGRAAWGNGAWGPGMMGQFWGNGIADPVTSGVDGQSGKVQPGNVNPWTYMGRMMGGNVPALTPELAQQMGQLHARVHGGDANQAAQWMLQMHNSVWGGAGQEQEQTPQAPAEPGAKRVEASVSVKEWKMDPANLSVAAGSRLVLTIRNDGDSPHHFVIPGLGLHLVDIAPGATRTVELNVDKAGTYPYFCDIPGHAQLGQQGTLTVTQAE